MVITRLLVLLVSVLSLQAVEIPATIKHVTDGDTIVVTTSDGAEVKVRMLFIDTPESKDNSHGDSMPEGKAAAAFLWDLLPVGETVTLWGPGVALEHDRYGRKLAVVWKGPESVNLAIIRAGWSPYWRKYGHAPGALHNVYIKAQDEAKAAKAGAWGTAPKYMIDKANETTAPKGKD